MILSLSLFLRLTLYTPYWLHYKPPICLNNNNYVIFRDET